MTRVSEPTVERQVAGAGRPRPRFALASAFFATPAQRAAAVVAAIAVLAGVGWWTYSGVRASLEESRADSLRAVLDAKIAGLEAWASAKRAEAERWAAVPEVVAAVRDLEAAARAGAPPAVLAAAPAQREFARLIAPAVAGDPERAAANAVDRSGRIVAGRTIAQIGLVVGDTMRADLARVFSGESRFLAPRSESERLPDAREPVFRRPVAWFAAPVRGADGAVIAALEIGSFADRRFGRILAPADGADPEGTSDAYAFDRRGVLLTQSRYAEVLQSAGVLPAGARTAAFNAQLRDPGVDLRERSPAGAIADRPYTALAAAALEGRLDADPRRRAGVLLAPYRNYAGLEVIGAWQWLPEYEIGVAVEIAAGEAFAPMRYLRVAMFTIFALLVGAVAAALGSTFSLAALGREVRQLGQYRIGEMIEEGGMATVHRAEHALLKRPTAVKILKRHLANEELIERFEREVTLASRLQHPATVEIYDYGRTRDGTFYFAMEFVDGITLAQLVERFGPLPARRAAYVLAQVCDSLREAHAKGLVHRDVKPQNIMLCERGGVSDVVKVVDWGLIKDVRAEGARDITRFSRMLGTLAYMPPERVRDPAWSDPLVDVYGLGAVAFFVLAGVRPFEAPDDFELQRRVVETAPPRASTLAPHPVPTALDALIARCLAKDPAERPQHVDEIAAVLAALLREDPWRQEEAVRWWRAFRSGTRARRVAA